MYRFSLVNKRLHEGKHLHEANKNIVIYLCYTKLHKYTLNNIVKKLKTHTSKSAFCQLRYIQGMNYPCYRNPLIYYLNFGP